LDLQEQLDKMVRQDLQVFQGVTDRLEYKGRQDYQDQLEYQV
jgi:hypothetical protein